MLRSKYDEVKLSLINLLWQQCAPNHPDLLEIPTCIGTNKNSQNKSKSIIESADQVGEYAVGDLLGMQILIIFNNLCDMYLLSSLRRRTICNCKMLYKEQQPNRMCIENNRKRKNSYI